MKILNAMLLLIACTFICAAQPSETTKWGKRGEGIQCSISLSNDVFSAGETISLKLLVRNSSTNTVKLEPSNLGYTPWCEFDFTSSSGKTFKFIHVATVVLEVFPPIPLKPGEVQGWDIPVETKTERGSFATKAKIKNGNYLLSSTVAFERDNQLFQLTSNLLKVQVK